VDEVKEKQKTWEDIVRPVLMKVYAASAGKGDPAAGMSGGSDAGPRVEEVD